MAASIKYSVRATCGAGVAILFWSACALIYCLLDRIPPAQLIGIAMTIGGLLSIAMRGQLPNIPRSRNQWLAIAALLLNQICYTCAFRMAPAAQVDLINYLWPLLVIVSQAVARNERLALRHSVGIGIGFLGPVLLIMKDVAEEGVCLSYCSGYLLAFGAALSWALYSLMGRGEKQAHAQVGDHLLIAGGISLLFQHCVGWQPMSGYEMLLILFLGVAIFGAAYPLWVHGIHKGHYTVVGGMANAIPLLSIALLVLGGFTESSIMLALSSLFVVAGCLCLGSKQPESKEEKVDIQAAGQANSHSLRTRSRAKEIGRFREVYRRKTP